MMTRILPLLLSAVLVLAGCGGDPVSHSAPVGINLKAKSSDTVNNVVTDDKGINTESGNPYGAFVTDARRELGNVDPAVIEVDEVEIFLGANSTGVTRCTNFCANMPKSSFRTTSRQFNAPMMHTQSITCNF